MAYRGIFAPRLTGKTEWEAISQAMSRKARSILIIMLGKPEFRCGEEVEFVHSRFPFLSKGGFPKSFLLLAENVYFSNSKHVRCEFDKVRLDTHVYKQRDTSPSIVLQC